MPWHPRQPMVHIPDKEPGHQIPGDMSRMRIGKLYLPDYLMLVRAHLT